jgi:hypothetical protein
VGERDSRAETVGGFTVEVLRFAQDDTLGRRGESPEDRTPVSNTVKITFALKALVTASRYTGG